MKYTVWTDGACSVNPGTGGLAYIILSHDEEDKEYSHSEGYQMTTNNRMEMLSIIKAIEFLDDKNPESILIKSDSLYSINTFSNWIWKWAPHYTGKRNIDLLKRIMPLLQKYKGTLRFEWVKGHDGNSMNEACDLLAKKESKKTSNLLIDENYLKS